MEKLDFDVVNFCASTMLQNSSKCWGLFGGWVSFQCMFMMWHLSEGGIGVRCSLFHVSSRPLVLFARGLRKINKIDVGVDWSFKLQDDIDLCDAQNGRLMFITLCGS